jgi:hypothetical protein
MTDSEKFAPGVMIDGKRYEPKGYEWILGFALGGCQWAIDAANKPGFREMVKRGEMLKEVARKSQMIRWRLDEIGRLEDEIAKLLDQMP